VIFTEDDIKKAVSAAHELFRKANAASNDSKGSLWRMQELAELTDEQFYRRVVEHAQNKSSPLPSPFILCASPAPTRDALIVLAGGSVKLFRKVLVVFKFRGKNRCRLTLECQHRVERPWRMFKTALQQTARCTACEARRHP
jgi:hypothetical protein